MTHPSPHELRAAERPVRSDFARGSGPGAGGQGRLDFSRERVYARRRLITLAVILCVAAAGFYAWWANRPRNPADIPTIRADGTYKQKPADPGGIDIPHQDVHVYDKLEGKTDAPQVEHLLPPPETPRDVPHAVTVTLPETASAASAPAPDQAAPAAAGSAFKADPVLNPVSAKQVPTTVSTAQPPAAAPVAAVTTPAPVSAPTSAPASTIDQVLKNVQTAPPVANTAPPAPGSVTIQLASGADEAKAQAMLKELQQKYAADLGGVSLRLVRADLGARGVFYRIQSQNIAESQANHICSALKQKHAGCILVRK